MKDMCKYFIWVLFFVVSRAEAASVNQGLTDFIAHYNAPIISNDGLINQKWVVGALSVVKKDGLVNDLSSEKVLDDITVQLWKAIEPTITYQARLPHNINNTEYKDRMWHHLRRSVEKILQQ